MLKELKVRVPCPVCGQGVLVKSLEGHLVKVHELTGVVTLRLHPASPFTHEPEAQDLELAPKGEEEQGGEQEQDQETKPEAKTEPGPAAAPETGPETAPEPKPKKK